MKFGKTFVNHQVPEWSQYYMNYKSLKKVIKSINKAQYDILNRDKSGAPSTIDHSLLQTTLNDQQIRSLLANFFFSLDRNIERVDEFYTKQFGEYERRLKKLSSIVSSSNILSSSSASLSSLSNANNNIIDEMDEIIGVLLDLRSSFRHLKWFGELNKRGFTKILKKLDKKVGTNQQSSYLRARVHALPFANENEIVVNLNIINDFLNKLGPQFENMKTTFTPSAVSDSKPLKSKKIDAYRIPIENDDVVGFTEQLIADFQSPILAPLKLLIALLNKAALYPSYKCIDAILALLSSIGDSSDISGRNFFHHHVISLGKQYVENLKQLELENSRRNTLTPAMTPDHNVRLFSNFGPDGINSNDSIAGLSYILSNLPIEFRHYLMQKDNYRRTPLHYASQYGLKDVTNIIIHSLKDWYLWDAEKSIDDISYWGDYENLTPLHLSVLGNHPITSKVLLDSMAAAVSLTCPRLILLAARLDSPALLKLLIGCKGINIDYPDPDSKETALYVSCRLKLVKSVEFLLASGADTELGESSFGWTPIFIAASDGSEDVVKSLISHGAIFEKIDESGWLPMEHACLRGHLVVAELLKPSEAFFRSTADSSDNSIKSPYLGSQITSPVLSPSKGIYETSQISTSSLDRVTESNSSLLSEKENIYKHISKPHPRPSSPPQPVKSFGHNYLKDGESLILITLGTTDSRDTNPPITFNKVPISRASQTELDTALSLVVSVRGLDEPPVVVDLPLDDNHGSATDPISFTSRDIDPTTACIIFDIVPTYQYNSNSEGKQKVLGRGVAFLGSIYTPVGKKMRSLYNVATVPILESETLEVLGSVRFEYMTVNSFTHPKMTIGRTETYWKSLVSTRVIGHRGLGKNDIGRQSLQLGENTVESFIAAASLGASYVEFDVQLTKDDVPVIYHDFTVAETGIDIPMHALTAEQFLGLSGGSSNDSMSKKLDSLDDRIINGESLINGGTVTPRGGSVDDDAIYKKPRPRSLSSYYSSSISEEASKKDLINKFNERMKLTKTWKEKGFKGNSRGTSIASSFVTLVELFKKLPKNVGFNIECKYPMLDEAELEDMGEVAVDINHYVDTVLKTVYEHADGRDVIFSSFHPDVCALLSLKQPSIPILFLTESGTAPMADIRANSLQSAIRFARKWNLLGIVSAAKTLVTCPRLAQVVKASGLVCVTYGVENNSPELAKLQMNAGVDAVIADSVLAVREGLTKA